MITIEREFWNCWQTIDATWWPWTHFKRRPKLRLIIWTSYIWRHELEIKSLVVFNWKRINKSIAVVRQWIVRLCQSTITITSIQLIQQYVVDMLICVMWQNSSNLIILATNWDSVCTQYNWHRLAVDKIFVRLESPTENVNISTGTAGKRVLEELKPRSLLQHPSLQRSDNNAWIGYNRSENYFILLSLPGQIYYYYYYFSRLVEKPSDEMLQMSLLDDGYEEGPAKESMHSD